MDTPTSATPWVRRRVIKRDGLLAKVKADGEYFGQQLHRALGGHRNVGDIRGRGLFFGVELVEDRATRAPFDPALKLHAKVKAEAMQRGLMCYPMGGTIDGNRGDHVLLAPPFIATRAELDEIVTRLAAAIDSGTASLKRAA
jgi:adenosylmethionine-8-amino-7-oxononanoate aminotransferase